MTKSRDPATHPVRGQVVNIKSYRGREYVYVGRRGHGHDGYYGNPCVIDQTCPVCGTKRHGRSETIGCFQRYARERIASDADYARRVRELYGKTLGCFCAPLPCHGEVLLELAAELVARQRILVLGSRDWSDGATIRDALRRHGPGTVLHTGEPGAGALAAANARELGWPTQSSGWSMQITLCLGFLCPGDAATPGLIDIFHKTGTPVVLQEASDGA